jgi:hypothetical protein
MTTLRRALHCKSASSRYLSRTLLGSFGALAASALLAATMAHAAPPPRKVSGSFSPFANCTADRPGTQPGIHYPNSEIEPWIEANPAHRQNLIAGWQQDRWSDGGARGLVAGVSIDGGVTWATVVPPRISKCSGGIYDRATDPWVAISPNGTAYFMSLAFDNRRPDGGEGQNAMLVSRSVNGGFSWSNPVSLIVDTDGRIFNDKNSMTADPHNSNLVYAVWDRIIDFTLPPGRQSGPAAKVTKPRSRDGVAQARERRRLLRQRALGNIQAAPTFKAPTVFVRTVNGGRSWEPPKIIYDPGNDAQTIGNLVAVHPNGAVINFFMNIDAFGDTRIGLQKSLNKGRSFASATLPIAANVTLTGTLTPNAQAPVRDGNILFDVAVDRQNGNLYLVWQDGRSGNMDKAFFSQSTDGGRIWSPPIRVAMTPPSPVRLRNQSSTPSVEVGPNHQIVVTYYDFRFDKSDGRELMDYFAVFCTPSATVDCSQRRNWGDGATPLKDIRLTRQSFDILNAPVAGGHFLGDYMGLTRRGNVMIPAFGIADGVNRTSVYTTPIRPNVAVTNASTLPE